MQERCCDDFVEKRKSLRKEYVVIDNKKIFPLDEEMTRQLKLYDEAHSRSKCISEEYLQFMEDELTYYINNRKLPLCEKLENKVKDCVEENKSTIACIDKVDAFIRCVDKTIETSYRKKYR